MVRRRRRTMPMGKRSTKLKRRSRRRKRTNLKM